MKIVESAQRCNPEQIARNMNSIVDQLKASVESAAAAGESFDSVERKTLDSVLQIGYQALELLLALQGNGDLGEKIQTSDDKIAERSQAPSTTKLRSIFGKHSFEQFTYASGKNKPISLRRISARLSLPAGRWSFLLQEFSQMLGVDQAYDQAMKNLGQIFGSNFSVDPHVRTAEDITAALFRDEFDENVAKGPRPKPQNKNTTAHFPEIDDDGEGGELAISGIHVGMAWIAVQVLARRRPGQVLIALMDGQESLWETMQMHFSFGARTVPILDILHALAYVWEAANLFEKEDAARRAFTRERLLKILRGEVAGVIQGLRTLGTRRGLKGERLKTLVRICGYLEKNSDRMRYDEYLRRGYPIASGVIEGACRHLVKDRMERSGMRWTLEGARSMLNVRAAFQGDHWRSFVEWHMQNEIHQTHSNRNLIQGYTAPALAC